MNSTVKASANLSNESNGGGGRKKGLTTHKTRLEVPIKMVKQSNAWPLYEEWQLLIEENVCTGLRGDLKADIKNEMIAAHEAFTNNIMQ